MKEELVAPCGMDCGVCSGYIARKYDVKSKRIRMYYCAGCHPETRTALFSRKNANSSSTTR